MTASIDVTNRPDILFQIVINQCHMLGCQRI